MWEQRVSVHAVRVSVAVKGFTAQLDLAGALARGVVVRVVSIISCVVFAGWMADA